MAYISDVLRRQIRERGGERCEYCRMRSLSRIKPHEVDHIYAEKHGGLTDENNLCLSCYYCNHYKGSDLCSLDPETGHLIALYHPRQDTWEEHFRLSNATIIPVTACGRVTTRLLRINDLERILEREMLIRLNLYP